MFKLEKELIKRFNEEQKFSSGDEKKPSPSDFAAGKPLRGILKRKREDLHNPDHNKEHDDIQCIEHSKKKESYFWRRRN
jgi:hypothetical protein